ncbi:hypothetical protein [Pseudanabaena sp. BC1403]|uniref:hypothetical protein n=1 Tax=Pseudanabaena sp. BC1403 TaxID=2043171 RepID=UPI0011AFBCA4|nr:hypothetical protein [Pseudanabaena sp. BC1403]
MRAKVLPYFFAIAVLSGLFTQEILSAPLKNNCTLKETNGVKQAKLSGDVSGKLTWNACTSIIQVFVFEFPTKRGVLLTHAEALTKAASLVREWRKETQTGLDPFREFPEALEKRAIQKKRYVFGENIPFSDLRGWAGTSVSMSSSSQTTQLTIRYWVNP